MHVPNNYIIPARVMHDKELGAFAKLLYGVLTAGNHDLSDEELSDFLKPQSAAPALQELLEHGYAAIIMDNKKRHIVLKK